MRLLGALVGKIVKITIYGAWRTRGRYNRIWNNLVTKGMGVENLPREMSPN